MAKLFENHRKNYGSFEIVDFPDQHEVSLIRNKLEVESPVSVHWTWEYGSEVAELRRLYGKGKANQWDAQTDLDWSTPVSKDDWVIRPEASILAQSCQLMGLSEATQKSAAFDEANYVLSQLLHGEQAALQLCGQLTNICEKMDEKWYAASQVIDEARHIEAFGKFLKDKMGTIYPVGPTVKMLLDILLEAKGVNRKTLGMQTLFEGTAVGIMNLLRSYSCNSLFSELIRRVEQDESRHAAFGVLVMRRVVEEANTEELEDMEDFSWDVMESLNANQQLDMMRSVAPKYDIDPEIAIRAFVAHPQHAELNSLAYMHTVVPNLVRLGLITDRTREKWRSVGMLTERRGENRPWAALLGGNQI